jgi:serine/threonine-protein kinase
MFERRVLRLYDAMLDQPTDLRTAWLASETGSDPVLIEAVEAMAAADRSAIALPTIPPSPTRIVDDAPPPARIGNYRIAGEIGRGGMGVVYLAERDDGLFDHKVAIKLIRQTVFSERALAQFATERRILARLRHPHIALMLDGGITAEGASYLIMEHIAGAPITDFCTQRSLPLTARLALFREATDAIEHAHRTLIVHADIKPSNVVVEDGFGVKLLDFGIARLLTDAAGQGGGGYSPGYASPARIAGMPPTPADDIFAAGILLRGLVADVPGLDADLTAIADKAAAEDPDRRYGAISELHADLARWQARFPVTARPPVRSHRMALFWQRNRLALTLASAGGLLVLATLAITTTLWLRAERARANAEARFEETRGLSRYMLDHVTTALSPLPGSAPVRKDIALRAEQMLEHLGTLPNDPAATQAEGAEGSAKVGEILSNLDPHDGGSLATAETALRRAEDMQRRLLTAAPGEASGALALAQTLILQAQVAVLAGNDNRRATSRLDEANQLLARARHDPAIAAAVRDQQFEGDLIRATMYDRDSDYARLGPFLHHMPLYAWRDPPTDPEEALRQDVAWNYVGDVLYYSNRMSGAVDAYRRALKATSSPALQGNARAAARQGYTGFALADSLFQTGHHKEAIAAITQSMAAMQQLRSFDATPPVRHMWQIVRLEYASEMASDGQFAEAIRAGRESLDDRISLAAENRSSYDLARTVPVAMRPLAEIYRKAGKEDEACAMLHADEAEWARIAKRWPLNGTDAVSEKALVKQDLAKCE